jgi:hypothetical protein
MTLQEGAVAKVTMVKVRVLAVVQVADMELVTALGKVLEAVQAPDLVVADAATSALLNFPTRPLQEPHPVMPGPLLPMHGPVLQREVA